MAGVGKLLKQAQKMQRQIESLQARQETREMEFTHGGGAVKIKINGAGRFLAITLDPEFLKEDPKFVNETLLAAIQEAARQVKEQNDEEMKKAASAFQMPGLM
ncbi:MAG: YbaB/EbfC family nucleoid-associated protein [Opitutaceae bacterium]|jgi:DNA-binding YbaB/EbfC family protein|nr:YbaB/EbfC family nucleoid-associated protein [Opitutaceae bacterium]